MRVFEFIETETVILSEIEGGRKYALIRESYKGGYRPHIVIESRTNRLAKMGIVNGRREVIDLYEPVFFWSGPYPVPVGEPAPITMVLFYAPDRYDYPAVQPDATFTIREGGKIVGHGVVRRRWTETIEQ